MKKPVYIYICGGGRYQKLLFHLEDSFYVQKWVINLEIKI